MRQAPQPVIMFVCLLKSAYEGVYKGALSVYYCFYSKISLTQGFFVERHDRLPKDSLFFLSLSAARYLRQCLPTSHYRFLRVTESRQRRWRIIRPKTYNAIGNSAHSTRGHGMRYSNDNLPSRHSERPLNGSTLESPIRLKMSLHMLPVHIIWMTFSFTPWGTKNVFWQKGSKQI